MRSLLKQWTRELARDDGAAGLIAVSLVVIVAFTALSLFLSGAFGPARDLERLQAAERANAATLEGVMVHFIRNQTVVCPDTNNDGDAESTCTNAGTFSGRIPWRTLNLGPDAALDVYDRYYTYIVSGNDDEKDMCESVENDFGGSAEYTGNMTQPSRLQVRTTGATDGYYVPFAIVSHGANGLGGVMRGASTAISGATGSELANATANPSAIYTGPYTSDTEDPFDDNVIVPSSGKLQSVCETLTPGGEANASFGDDFNAPDDTFDTDKWAVSGAGTPTQGAGQANFETSGAGYLATAAGVNVVATVRPIYVSAQWVPQNDNNTFHIVTRALPGSTATNGVTFTFGPTTTITEDGDIGTAPTDTLDVIGGQRYLLEIYDDGNDVWGRATQASDPTNSASVRFLGVDNDVDLNDRLVFANGDGVNRLDNVIVGYPMLTLETGGAAYGHAPAASGAGGGVTVEVWVRPQTTSGQQTLVAQWDTGDDSDSTFRLYLDGAAVRLALRDSNEASVDLGLGISVASQTWTHIAFSYDAVSHAVQAYRDGAWARSVSTTLTAGLHAPTEGIGFGGDSVSGVPANIFEGQLSDVRIWSSVRAHTDIASCFNRRLGAGCGTAGATGNWTMDPTLAQDGLGASTILALVGNAGTLVSAEFTPSLSVYFRATSSDVCPDNQAGAYQCDYRVAGAQTDPTFPATVATFYAKAWGGGQNGTLAAGEGGAYAGGTVDNSGAITVTVGDNGLLGGDTAVDGDGQTVTAPGGGSLFNILDVLLGILGGVFVETMTQDAANNTDPHYPPTTPGRGGAAGSGAGNDGAVVLIW